MSANSKIEWTETTWNPIAGCSVVSPGCTNCYAMRMAARLEAMGQAKYAGTTKPSKAGAVWTGKIAFDEGALLAPLRWKKPRRIFVNSMSDLFHEGVPDEAIDAIFETMRDAPQHTFQILTKRADRMREVVRDLSGTSLGVLPNVWLGVSVENQRWADERIPLLLDTPAAVRWISAEPLLGPVDLTDLNPGAAQTLDATTGVSVDPPALFQRLDWVVAGGESGPDARPSQPVWFRSLRNQCAAAGVPFFFKQWGEWAPDADLAMRECLPGVKVSRPTARKQFKSGPTVARVGKKAAGRTLDGRTHDEYPSTANHVPDAGKKVTT